MPSMIILGASSFIAKELIGAGPYKLPIKAVSRRIPEDIKQFPSPIECAAFDSNDENRFFLYGQGFCLYVDLLLEIPEKPRIIGAISPVTNEPSVEELQDRIINQHSNGNSSKKKNLKKKLKNILKKIESRDSLNKNFTLFTQYRSIVNLSMTCGKGTESELVSNVIMSLSK